MKKVSVQKLQPNDIILLMGVPVQIRGISNTVANEALITLEDGFNLRVKLDQEFYRLHAGTAAVSGDVDKGT